jgi:hypothetical protein
MKKLFLIAEELDNLGHFSLSDKMFRVVESQVEMDASQYYDNPHTPKEILKLRNKLLPTNFRDEIRRYEGNERAYNRYENILNSNSPMSFIENLFLFAVKNKSTISLTDSFDDYADADATYSGVSIKYVPALVELYKIVKSNARMFSKAELSGILKDLLAEEYSSETFGE